MELFIILLLCSLLYGMNILLKQTQNLTGFNGVLRSSKTHLVAWDISNESLCASKLFIFVFSRSDAFPSTVMILQVSISFKDFHDHEHHFSKGSCSAISHCFFYFCRVIRYSVQYVSLNIEFPQINKTNIEINADSVCGANKDVHSLHFYIFSRST